MGKVGYIQEAPLRFVLGFAFCQMRTGHDAVLLIMKRRGPQQIVGKWNGIGGKIEAGESPLQAMSREFFEETGRSVLAKDWRPVVRYVNAPTPDYPEGYAFDVFSTRLQTDYLQQTTDEPLHWWGVRAATLWEEPTIEVVPNLRWLIPLCLDPHVGIAHVFERI